MWTAVGIGVRQIDGAIEVTASLRLDGVEVSRRTFAGADLDEVTAKISDDLATRAAAEDDANLSATVVGRTLVEIDSTQGGVMTRKVLGTLVVALLLAVGVAHAQGTVAAPELTELERTKVELLQVRTAYAQLLAQYDACKAEVGSTFNTLGSLRARAASDQLTAEEAQIKLAVETGHPGYTWDPKTGLFTKKADPPTAGATVKK